MTAPGWRLTRRAVLTGLGAAMASELAGGCAREAIASGLLTTRPEDRAATFRRVDRILPTRVVRRGPEVRALPVHPRPLAADGNIEGFIRRNRVAGLLALKDGAVALERYALGNGPRTRWTTFSLAKSVTSTLVGAALHAGALAGLDDPITTHVAALRGSAYDGVTIRQALRMCSGVQWNEEYSPTGDSDIARLSAALTSRRRCAVMDLMRTRTRAAAPGTRFNYSTGESYVLGAAAAGATGRTLADLLSRTIWSRAGMESDAYWCLDGEDGLEMGGNNLSATLRDYARFGQVVLDDGVIAGVRVLPTGWRDLVGRPDDPITAPGASGSEFGYGYHWWSFPDDSAAGSRHTGALLASGIYGQFLYVHPPERLVVVMWSAWSAPWLDEAARETYALLAAIVERLSGEAHVAHHSRAALDRREGSIEGRHQQIDLRG